MKMIKSYSIKNLRKKIIKLQLKYLAENIINLFV